MVWATFYYQLLETLIIPIVTSFQVVKFIKNKKTKDGKYFFRGLISCRKCLATKVSI